MTILLVVGGLALFAVQVLAWALVYKFEDESREFPPARDKSNVRIVHKKVA